MRQLLRYIASNLSRSVAAPLSSVLRRMPLVREPNRRNRVNLPARPRMPVRLAARIAVRMMMQIEEQLALHEHPGLVRHQVPTPGGAEIG